MHELQVPSTQCARHPLTQCVSEPAVDGHVEHLRHSLVDCGCLIARQAVGVVVVEVRLEGSSTRVTPVKRSSIPVAANRPREEAPRRGVSEDNCIMLFAVCTALVSCAALYTDTSSVCGALGVETREPCGVIRLQTPNGTYCAVVVLPLHRAW